MPVKLRNRTGKNFGASELPGPNLAQKRVRAEILSVAPGLFNANRTGPMPINDVAKSMGVSDLIKSTSIPKVKRAK